MSGRREFVIHKLHEVSQHCLLLLLLLLLLGLFIILPFQKTDTDFCHYFHTICSKAWQLHNEKRISYLHGTRIYEKSAPISVYCDV